MGSEKKSQLLRALGVSFCLAVRSGNTYTSCPTSWRVADLLYGLWTGRCEGGRHVKVPGHRNQREKAASQGRRSPTDGTLADRRGQVCQSPSSQWRGQFPAPLWFLSITYQPGQSVAEMKQFLRTDGLWTQRGKNSPRSFISLNLKRYINPWKAKITVRMTPVWETDGNINTICVGSSVFYLTRQQENM